MSRHQNNAAGKQRKLNQVEVIFGNFKSKYFICNSFYQHLHDKKKLYDEWITELTLSTCIADRPLMTFDMSKPAMSLRGC